MQEKPVLVGLFYDNDNPPTVSGLPEFFGRLFEEDFGFKRAVRAATSTLREYGYKYETPVHPIIIDAICETAKLDNEYYDDKGFDLYYAFASLLCWWVNAYAVDQEITLPFEIPPADVVYSSEDYSEILRKVVDFIKDEPCKVKSEE